MKLPLLLTQFLYQHKKLNLPGIGSFTMDPSAILPEDGDKNQHEIVQGIEFIYVPTQKADDELINFIRLHTGKMKPLAEADLDSFLTLGIQLLNIGKPFYLDGIGAISKNQDGRFVYTPGEYVSFNKEESTEKREKIEKRKPIFEEQHDQYSQPQSTGLRKLFIALVLLGGLIIIGWGGYMLYKRNTYPTDSSTPPATISQDSFPAKTDTSSTASAKDTLLKKTTNNPPLSGMRKDTTLYKFVILATNHKYRAFKRYEQLLSYQLNIKMETKDSSFFKLYFSFPALPKDTTMIKDSLDRVYATKSFIEKKG